jgi:folate-binding protein YgfZ
MLRGTLTSAKFQSPNHLIVPSSTATSSFKHHTMFTPRRSDRLASACKQCIKGSRSRPYSTQPNSPPPPPPTSGAAKLTTRRLISLHGPEAPKFLQGIITNNLRADSRSGFYSAFLTAPGKVLNDVFVYPTFGSKWHSEANKNSEDQGYLVEVDADDAAFLFKHIKRHKLRAKLALRLLDEGELDVWNAWRDDDRWTAHSQGVSEDGTISLTDCRAPGLGQRILLPSSSSGSGVVGNTAALDGLEEAPLSAYTIRRYLRGVAEGQKEIPREETLPMNANIDLMNGIDFKKGCYIGQELTIRTHHTGVVRRRILPVSLYDPATGAPEKLEYDSSVALPTPDRDTEIRKDDKRKRATGKLIASVGNIGLGMCRLEQMTDLVVSGEPSPFTPEDKFTVQAMEQTLGIKAFVPDWIRGQIRGPRVQKRVE